MLIKKSYDQTVVKVYTDNEGGYYTITPFQKYEGIYQEYCVMYQDGLGERWVEVWNIERLDDEFGYRISTIFTDEKVFELTIN
jgi:hypothetical protein